MHVIKGAKEKKKKKDHKASKVFTRLLSISHFITHFLFLCFCSSFHAFTFNTKVFYQFHLQIDRDNTNCHAHPLRFMWIECSIIISPMQMPQTEYFDISVLDYKA